MAKDHYVPQFYLRGFIDPASHTYPEPFLWLVDTELHTLRKRSPKNVAYIRDFYNWESLGNKLPAIEQIYSTLEEAAASIIFKLQECKMDSIQLTPDDKYLFSHFLSIQLTRSPRFRKNFTSRLQNSATSSVKNYLNELISDKDKLETYFEGQNLEQIKALIQNVELIPKIDAVLGATLVVVPKLAKDIFQMEWLFLISEINFLTTDQPVSVFWADDKRSEDFKTEGSLLFPILPSIALKIQGKIQSEKVIHIDSEHTEWINRKMLSSANRFVFCPNEDLGIWTLKEIVG